MKKLLFILLLLPMAAFADCSVNWTAPTENVDGSPLIDLTSYNLTINSTGTTPQVISIPGTETSHLVALADTGLNPYAIHMTALNSGNLESDPSPEILIQVTNGNCVVLGASRPGSPIDLNISINITIN